ncbi:MAG: anthranilate phosphoribosyltransferase [Pyrinomonadaceae bacterium]
MPSISTYIEMIHNGTELVGEASEQCFDSIVRETDVELLSAFLSAWNYKGVTTNEIFEFASIMRRRAVKVQSKHKQFVDVVGTGGSAVKTFNVSTAAAFVVAGAGVPVAKHGNRSATSASGSADVIAKLGVNPAVDAGKAEFCLNEVGICFMFAPNFHSLSAALAAARSALGSPTIFNSLGPLCNPAGAPHQLIGVWNEELVERTASALARLGTKKSWVVHGRDGLDEITLNDKTLVSEVIGQTIRTFEIAAADLGLSETSRVETIRRSPEESAALILEIFEGARISSAEADLVLANAAAPIFLTGFAESISAAVEVARQSLVSGAALRKLNELVAATNG